METVSPRRWYRLHRATWFVVIVVAAAFGYCQFVEQPGITLVDQEYTRFSYFGWPRIQLAQVETGSSGFMSTGIPLPSPTFEYEWDVPLLTLNCLVGLLIVVSSALVFESWLRSLIRTQFSLLGLAKFISVIAVLLTLTIKISQVSSALGWYEIAPGGLFVYQSIAWPIGAVIFLGAGCTIYTVGWAACRLVGWLFNFVSRRSAVVQS